MKKPAKLNGNKFNFNSEVSMKKSIFQNLVFEHDELTSNMDHVEEFFSMHEPMVRYDKESGEEVDADKVLTPALANVYVPGELFELEVDDEAGYVSDAALCLNDLGDLVYEEDFNDALNRAYEEDIMITETEYMSKEQQQTNYDYYLAKLHAVKTAKELYAWKDELLDVQKNTKSGVFMFAKGMSQQLWTEYHAFKGTFWAKRDAEQASNEAKAVKKVEEYCAMIVKTSDNAMLQRIYDEVYHDYLPLEVKKVIWSKIWDKRKTGTCTIDADQIEPFVLGSIKRLREAKKAKYASNKAA